MITMHATCRKWRWRVGAVADCGGYLPLKLGCGAILLGTAPLIPLFMALVGMGAPMLTDVTFSLLLA